MLNYSKLSENKHGKYYLNGVRLSLETILTIKMEFLEKGLNKNQISKKLHLDWHTVDKWVKRDRIFNVKSFKGKINDNLIEFLKEVLGKDATLYLKEMKEILIQCIGLNVSEATISRTLEHFSITKKKLIKVAYYRNLYRIQYDRMCFRTLIKNFELQQIINVDECSVKNSDLCRKEGWGHKSEKVRSLVHKLSRKSWTLICCISFYGLVYWKLVPSKGNGCNGDDFYEYLKELYVVVPKNLFLLLDGATTHKTTKVKNMINKLLSINIVVIKNSGYSPDYAPIELFFNWYKNQLKDYQHIGTVPEATNIIMSSSKINEICAGFYREAERNWNSNKF